MVQHIFSQEKPVGDLDLVMAFEGPMPTGVSVSHSGRIFVNFPRWDDPVDFTVAELREEKLHPYPNAEMQRTDTSGVRPYYQTTPEVNIVHPESKPFQIRWEAHTQGWNGAAWCYRHLQ
jgi:hypothetical protein